MLLAFLTISAASIDALARAGHGSGRGSGHHAGHAGGHRFYSAPRVRYGWYAGGFYPPLYPYFYPYYPPAASVPPVYIEKGPEGPALSPGFWYYCASGGAYYPNVGECPEGWQQVLPQAE